MKQKLFTLLTLLVLCVTGAWAQDEPDFNREFVSGDLKVHNLDGGETITISSSASLSSSSGYYVNLSSSPSGYNTQYLSIVSSKNISKIAVLAGPGGSNKAVSPVFLGWSNTASNNNVVYSCTKATASISSSAKTDATWVTSDEIEEDVKEIRIYRAIPANTFSSDDGTTKLSAMGSTSTSLRVWGVRVWLVGDVDDRDPLTLNFSANASTNIAVGDELSTTLTWDENTSSEEAKYSVAYTSSDDAVATVNSSGVITGVAEGTATITATVTADADATYKTTKATITVNVTAPWTKHANFTTPTATLDFTDADVASAGLTGRWSKDAPYYGNDGADNYVVVTPYTVYNDRATLTWASIDATGNSSTAAWDATDVFLGSTYYTQEDSKARYATQRQDRAGNYYCYRVKGVSKVKLLYKSNGTINVTLGAFEITAGTAASTTMLFTRGNSSSASVMTLDGLDASKEYLITTDNSYENTSTTQSQLYELAFFYGSNVEIAASVTPAKEYTTYVTTNAVDFTGLDVEAYVATSTTTSAVTLEKVTSVPAKTPLILKGTAATEYKIPVCAPVSAPATNLLLAGPGTGDSDATIGGDARYDYILSDGQFYRAEEGKLANTKAYLHLEAAPSDAKALSIIFNDGETTSINNIEEQGARSKEQEGEYNLAGQKVSESYKGIVIKNGRKYINK